MRRFELKDYNHDFGFGRFVVYEGSAKLYGGNNFKDAIYAIKMTYNGMETQTDIPPLEPVTGEVRKLEEVKR